MPEHSQSILERLEEQHSFPGSFMFKAIGPNNAPFVAAVTQAVVVVLGVHTVPDVRTKESSGGRHIAVTLVAQVQRSQQVVDIWALMAKVDGVKMVM